jgi:hypothetical protein
MRRLRNLGRGANLNLNLPQAMKRGNQPKVNQPPKKFEPPREPPTTALTLDDMSDSLKMYRVDKGGYLTDVPEDKVGHFYAGDSYVIFCKYKVSGDLV